jgi:hypothetical protein
MSAASGLPAQGTPEEQHGKREEPELDARRRQHDRDRWFDAKVFERRQGAKGDAAVLI